MTIETELPTTATKASTEISDTVTGVLQNFTPIKGLCKHFNGIHGYAKDPSRQILSDHYCAHLTEDLRQCLIYDTHDSTTARLIGVEYIISRPMFESLPSEEKRYWHSHSYKVNAGLLMMPRVPDAMEHVEMAKLVNTYGKTWHFWQVDRGDPLPYGEPQLMCSFTKDGMVSAELLAKRDSKFGIHTDTLRKKRVNIQSEPVHPLADQFLHHQG